MEKKRKALFIDRDGVINRSALPHEYVTRVEDFEILPGTFEALRQLAEAGYDLYVITNQAGIGRGQTTWDEVNTLHKYMQSEFEREGITLQAIYVCPHKNEDNCNCRKPKPGLLLQAIREHNIDPSQAIFVGDRETDMEAARGAGVRGVLIPSEVGMSAALPELLKLI
ncbi:HAD family hydrolase [Candidatus Kaiserbacteria bacterium]|nr:HAD family hydrolase [Candidatus Kaiserbacteria bacterium]